MRCTLTRSSPRESSTRQATTEDSNHSGNEQGEGGDEARPAAVGRKALDTLYKSVASDLASADIVDTSESVSVFSTTATVET